MACVLCGNTSFPLDSKETAFFYQMEKSDIEIIIVDLNTLYSDIDLTPFKKVKVVLTFGSNNKYKLTVGCPILVLEDCVDLLAATTDSDYKRVYAFEETANKMQVITLSQTSGSTGYGVDTFDYIRYTACSNLPYVARPIVKKINTTLNKTEFIFNCLEVIASQ